MPPTSTVTEPRLRRPPGRHRAQSPRTPWQPTMVPALDESHSTGRSAGRRTWRSRYLRRLVPCDVLTGLVAGAAGLTTQLANVMPALGFYVLGVPAVALVWVGSLATADAYGSRRLAVGNYQLRAVARATITLLAAVAIVAFLSNIGLSRIYLFTVMSTLVVGSLIARLVLLHWLHENRRQGRLMQRTVVVGRADSAAALIHSLLVEPSQGLLPVAVCATGVDGGEVQGREIAGVSLMGPTSAAIRAVDVADAEVVAVASSRRPRVAVVCEGDPTDPSVWSGTPYGVLRGLRECGVEVMAVRGAPQGRAAVAARTAFAVAGIRSATRPGERWRSSLRRSLRVSPLTAGFGTVGTAYAAAGLRRCGPVDAVVQMGSSFVVRHPRVVTFEDMTIRQAVAFDQYEWRELSDPQLEDRLRRQQRIYADAVAVTLATPWAARSVTQEYGIDPAKVEAVGLGRNHDITPAPRDWGAPRFLFVGFDWDRKNGASVLEAFAAVRLRHPQATLDVAGRHPVLRADGVRGHGPLSLSDPAESAVLDRLFGRATCLVVPSRFEAAGIVYLEAAAAGLPSIGTTRGGAADLVGRGGRVVAPDDPAALRETMLRLCDPALAAGLGELGRRRAREFTWQAVAARLLARAGIGAQAHPVSW